MAYVKLKMIVAKFVGKYITNIIVIAINISSTKRVYFYVIQVFDI